MNIAAMPAADRHHLIENENGELLLVLDARTGEPEEPVLMVDADRNEAVLQRGPEDFVALPMMHSLAALKLRDAEQIVIAEVGEDDIVWDYHALLTVISRA